MKIKIYSAATVSGLVSGIALANGNGEIFFWGAVIAAGLCWIGTKVKTTYSRNIHVGPTHKKEHF